MGSGGEVLADQGVDVRLDSGNLTGNLDIVHPAKPAAFLLGLVMPVDAVQVHGIDVPKPDLVQFLQDGFGNQGRITHLLERGKENALLPAELYVLGPDFRVHGQINQHGICLQLFPSIGEKL